MEDQANSTSKVRVQFSSRDAALQLPEGTGPILLSTGLKRYALSTLVNNLLETDNTVPFEFLVDGLFLRTSIADYLSAHGLSTESTLTIEYVKALTPPTDSSILEHEDWVSTVQVYSSAHGKASWIRPDIPSTNDDRILTGSYDGLLRMWTSSARVVAISESTTSTHLAQAIKCARFVNNSTIASAGDDRVIRLWRYTEQHKHSQEGEQGTFSNVLELYGHRSSIENIAISAGNEKILSASTDHCVGLWSTRKSDSPSAPESLLPVSIPKRRKTQQTDVVAAVARRGPLRLLQGHSGPVTGVVFSAKDATLGYSCSWDHTLLTWDLVTGMKVSTRRTMHPLLCIAELRELGVLVVGSTARHLSIVDPRADARDVSGMTLRGHVGAVSSVDSEPDQQWGLVSASHDGSCKIWDLRSVRTGDTAASITTAFSGQVCDSVYSIARESSGKGPKTTPGEQSKVFAVQWDRDVGIVSAGQDKAVQINRPVLR